MNLKNERVNALLTTLFLMIPLTSLAEDKAEVYPARRNQLSFSVGNYSLSAPGTSLSSIGAVTLTYSYRFQPAMSVMAAYNNLLTTKGGISSIVSGFDIGAQYCFLSCTVLKQNLGDVASITQWSPFGIQVGAGFAQRSIQLSSASVGFSGPFGRLEMNYLLSETLKILGSAQYTTMSNSSRKVTQMTFQVGVGFEFGTVDN